jgi:antitoxin VapB
MDIGSSLKYIHFHIYFRQERQMPTRTARLFTNGGSQAVRLPAEFRFNDTDAVYIRRDAVTGDVVLSSHPVDSTWSRFFAVRDQARVTDDPAGGRPDNTPLQPRRVLGD